MKKMSEVEIYVTNTATFYTDSGVEVRAYGRTEDGSADSITSTGFEPYFFVHNYEGEKLDVSEHEDIVRKEVGAATSLKNSVPQWDDKGKRFFPQPDLTKIVATHPGAVGDLREKFSKTWEADVEFTNRFRIDKEIRTGMRAPGPRVSHEMVEPLDVRDEWDEVPEPRVCTFDIEVDDRGHGFPGMGEERILSIVAHDNYDDEVVAFLDMDGQSLEERLPRVAKEQKAPEYVDELVFEPDERRMLIQFACWLDERDPDIITGWYSNGFDLPYLIKRMSACGVNPDRMARDEGKSFVKRSGDPKIQGRALYDMLPAWKSTKFRKVPGSLDWAAEHELDEKKIEHLRDFYTLYEEDTRKFLNYNAKDTVLVKRIWDEVGVLSFKTRLRDLIGLDYEWTLRNHQFIDMMVRRKVHERGVRSPTRVEPEDGKGDEPEYEGAYVVEAFSGIAENVVGIDLASLYPYTMLALNASPETIVDPERHHGDTIWAPQTGDKVHFRTDVQGLFPELVVDAIELKATYKEKRNAAEAGTDEYEKWAEFYNVAKTITNSLYGTTGWVRFFLYEERVAEAVTLTGQRVLAKTQEICDQKEHVRVIYGDTDSNYLKFPDDWDQARCVMAAMDICAELNEVVYPWLAHQHGMDESHWEIEVEMFARRFFQAEKKKRYAYLRTWKEGMRPFEIIEKDGEIGEVKITGFESVRSDTAALTEDVMEDTLEAIVRGKTDSEIADIVFEYATQIDPEDPDWEYIGIPGGIGKKLDNYEVERAHVRGAKNANKLCGTNFGKGSKPKRCYLKDPHVKVTIQNRDGTTEAVEDVIDVIGYEYEADLEPIKDQLVINASRMQNVILRKPMERILDPIGIDVDAAMQGQLQHGLGRFM